LNSNGKGQLLQICILTNLLLSLNQNIPHNCCGVYILVNEVLDDCVKNINVKESYDYTWTINKKKGNSVLLKSDVAFFFFFFPPSV